MEIRKFKTSMKCSGCVAAVATQLDALEGIQEWGVDVASQEKILTITGELSTTQIVNAVEKAGFTAELLS